MLANATAQYGKQGIEVLRKDPEVRTFFRTLLANQSRHHVLLNDTELEDTVRGLLETEG